MCVGLSAGHGAGSPLRVCCDCWRIGIARDSGAAGSGLCFVRWWGDLGR